MEKILLSRIEGSNTDNFRLNLQDIDFDQKNLIDEQLIKIFFNKVEVEQILHGLFGSKALECYVRLDDQKYPIERLQGYLAVKVNDDDLLRIKQNVNCAYPFWGGYIFITNIINSYEFTIGMFTQVK